MKQPELSGPAPALVEYTWRGATWRCSAFGDLAAEFGVAVAELGAFQDTASVRERGWRIVRRLFGMMPVVPPAGADAGDMRRWGRLDLCEDMGLKKSQLQEELEAVRGAWSATRKSESRKEKATPDPSPGEGNQKPAADADADGQAKLRFAGDEILEKYGFRQRFRSVEEGRYFAQRVRDYEKLLNQKQTAGLGRAALMTELQLWQMDDYMSDTEKSRLGSADWRSNMKVLDDLRSAYQAQLKQIDELAPWASEITGKNSFVATLSTVTQAMQEYAARGDTRLVDGLFTANEVRVELRRSVQAPEPRYRLGLVGAVAAARAGLWDPNWKTPFTPRELRKLDKAFGAALKESDAAEGKPLTDLEAGQYHEDVEAAFLGEGRTSAAQ